MSLQVHNALTRRKVIFVPLQEGRVTMYVCGPTVYDHAHLGHAKLYVSMDVIARYLRFKGLRVRYVQNITDVGHLLDTGEDRILKGAARERVEPMELVEIYTRSYFEDMDALGVTRPDISPRASAHIPEQIEIVKALIEMGYAYEVNGSVYFDVTKWPQYGKLSGRQVEEQEEGARVAQAVREEKLHPADFSLWKRAEPEHILRWNSPWSWGYPGWHVECTAMANKYLGPTFDIHGGGLENIFPHNECEIAQSEAWTGKQFARYWLLAGSLTINGVKMSKSLGNFVTLKDALNQYRPEAIRYFVLSSHYRNPVDYSAQALEAATAAVRRLLGPVMLVREHLRAAPEGEADTGVLALLEHQHEWFANAMDDDFNAPAALAVLFDLTTEVNKLLNSDVRLSRGTLEAIDSTYRALGGRVLGIVPEQFHHEADWELLDGLVKLLIELRAEARAARDFARADAIRDRLATFGVTLEDRVEGTTWRLNW
jgi:cysteinyl-tRNA synthetase